MLTAHQVHCIFFRVLQAIYARADFLRIQDLAKRVAIYCSTCSGVARKYINIYAQLFEMYDEPSGLATLIPSTN